MQVRPAAGHVAGEDVVDAVVGQRPGEGASVEPGDEPAEGRDPDVDDGVDLVKVQELDQLNLMGWSGRWSEWGERSWRCPCLSPIRVVALAMIQHYQVTRMAG